MQRNSRRSFLVGLAATAASVRARAGGSSFQDRLELASKRLAAIEAREGGRLGVTVLDTATGSKLEHRADERFPMCSTFKLLAVAAALKLVDANTERLDRKIAYGPSDLLDYAPIAKAHVADGGMTLADLCAAAIDWSDNTAANLILDVIGGPAGFTQFARSLGNSQTRLDRNEPDLNAATPGDERDTTTPEAMAADMTEGAARRRAVGDVSPPARGLAHRRQGWRQAAASRAPAHMAHRRQDRHGRSRHGECDRDNMAARPGADHRYSLLHRVVRAGGSAECDSQGNRQPDRGDVLNLRATGASLNHSTRPWFRSGCS